jgi:hypothetical protein
VVSEWYQEVTGTLRHLVFAIRGLRVAGSLQDGLAAIVDLQLGEDVGDVVDYRLLAGH